MKNAEECVIIFLGRRLSGCIGSAVFTFCAEISYCEYGISPFLLLYLILRNLSIYFVEICCHCTPVGVGAHRSPESDGKMLFTAAVRGVVLSYDRNPKTSFALQKPFREPLRREGRFLVSLGETKRRMSSRV